MIDRLRESKCTVLQATPVSWQGLIEAGWKGQSNLRAFCGGEALSRDLAEQLLPRVAELWNLYGPTETTVWSAAHKVTSGAGPVPIGYPIDNTDAYVLDAHRNLAPVGVTGELYIGGAGVARGYLRREDLTAERFVPHPFQTGATLYRTGDLARRRADGTLECLGSRTDSQIGVPAGSGIEPGRLEAQRRWSIRCSRSRCSRVAGRFGRPEHRRVHLWKGGRHGDRKRGTAAISATEAAGLHDSSALRRARIAAAHPQRQSGSGRIAGTAGHGINRTVDRSAHRSGA